MKIYECHVYFVTIHKRIKKEEKAQLKQPTMDTHLVYFFKRRCTLINSIACPTLHVLVPYSKQICVNDSNKRFREQWLKYITSKKKTISSSWLFTAVSFNHKLIKKKWHGERIPRIHRFVEESWNLIGTVNVNPNKSLWPIISYYCIFHLAWVVRITQNFHVNPS